MSLSLIRLALLGSRGNMGRHLAIGGGIAFGTVLLVLLLGVSTGLKRRDERGGWLYSGILMPKVPQVKAVGGLAPVEVPGSIRVGETFDYFKQSTIMVIHVSAPPETNIKFPGVSRPPMPGEFFVSPALNRLMGAVPSDELARRFSGHQIGLIDQSLLNSSDSLVVVAGDTQSVVKSDQFMSVLPPIGYVVRRRSVYTMKLGILSSLLRGFLNIAGIALAFPVIVLIGTFGKLGAAARNERYATFRLMGATPLQIGYIAGIETAVVGALGSIVGVILGRAILPVFAELPIDRLQLLSSDIGVDPGGLIVVVALMTIISTISTIIGVLILGIPPLGYNRRIAERKPTILHMLPLGVGLALTILGRALFVFSKESTHVGAVLMLIGFPICIIGVLRAGPWLTFVFSRIMSKYVTSPAGLIAANRICCTPSAVFRTASGLVVIVFLLSYIYGSFALIGGNEQTTPSSPTLPDHVISASTSNNPIDLQETHQVVAELKRVPGVLQAAATYSAPGRSDNTEIIASSDAAALGRPILSSPSNYETFDTTKYLGSGAQSFSAKSSQINPDLQARLRPEQVIAVTDGQPDSMERARTVLDRAYGGSRTRSSDNQLLNEGMKFMEEIHLIANLVIAFIIVISGCSLAVAAMVGMIDRRRAFGLLRLVGMPLSDLKKIVLIEALVPMLAVTLFSALSGFLAADLFIGVKSWLFHMDALPPEYYGTIGIGLAIALVVMVCTAQMAGKTTAGPSTRFE